MRGSVHRCAWLLACLLLMAGCADDQRGTEDIVLRGELRLVTRNSPTTYYLGRESPQGFEYDLALALARELKVELTIQQVFTLEEMFEALERGEADIVGAGLTFTGPRAARFAATRPYAKQRPQIVYKVGEQKPRTIDDLKDQRLAVLAGSSQEYLLNELRDSGYDWLQWQGVKAVDPIEVLQMVNEDEANLAVVNSRDFYIAQNLVPRIEVAFDLAAAQDIVWYLPASARSSGLLARVDEFLSRQESSGTLTRLHKNYFDRDEDISRIDTQTFVNRARRDLRSYQQLIEVVAREYRLPWELLAAISYQESHWDPKATSRTGVRGMMMLTSATAEELGVRDRTDPSESLRGGARYFKQLRKRLPPDIQEPDRSWFALAAYNIGMGHLEDARVLTEQRGGDPHLWQDVMDALPLLEDATHYQSLRYGYARGLESVRFVQNIRHYHNILRWQTARASRPKPPADLNALLPEQLRGLRLRAL